MTQGGSMRAAVVAVLFAVTVGLTGCAGQQSGYGSDIADRLQGEVLEVSTLSAEADFAAALLALTELDVELKDARARGEITEERYESVTAAAALVRADLEAAIAAQAPPPPAPEPEDDDEDKDEEDKGKDDKGKDDKGKGKGKGED
jgi:hypothetical protein